MELPYEIQERYLLRRKHDLEVCLVALESKNFSELEKIGHQLKGNGRTFGHPELTILGSKLERGARQRSFSEVEIIVKALSGWIGHHLN